MNASVAAVILLATLSAGGDVHGQIPKWHSDYYEAMELADTEHRMLLVEFHKDGQAETDDPIVKLFSSDPVLRKRASDLVLVRIPISTRAIVEDQEIQLVRHSAFSELNGELGIAIIDLTDPKSTLYGDVVSIYPFSLPGALTAEHLTTLVNLPKGTLTQRTLIYVVRTHTEKPQSADGTRSELLTDEATSHSRYQAAVQLQGHQQWESRFHRITARLPGGLMAQEVCAESWPGEGLIRAAFGCVYCWRQSPGHWNAVRSKHRFFGFDIQRDSRGKWYATGIFSNP